MIVALFWIPSNFLIFMSDLKVSRAIHFCVGVMLLLYWESLYFRLLHNTYHSHIWAVSNVLKNVTSILIATVAHDTAHPWFWNLIWHPITTSCSITCFNLGQVLRSSSSWTWFEAGLPTQLFYYILQVYWFPVHFYSPNETWQDRAGGCRNLHALTKC